ncbi:MAG: alpha-1,2-fucosyltransferase [Bacteroidetes bacterium]|nr:alpha-1,2-fucosyltransferase [Bacteroidota bacterium]
MIVVKLIGGLGNQLFQYAAGIALANYHKTELFLDISYLNADTKGAYTKRKFELDKFNITAKLADIKILENFNFDENIFRMRLKKLSPGLFNKMIFNEHQFNFHNNFLKLPNTTYLNGYWQSEKYFNSFRVKLLEEITLTMPLSEEALAVDGKIREVNSVSLHVRRGDFVSLKSANHFHGHLDIDYYKLAFEKINTKIKDATYFIFSDDMDWCKANFDFIPSKKFVDGEMNNISTHEELILMSHCRHNIIANSSFSWWGAWLNQNSDKIVIAPKNWFADKTINTNDLIPGNWIKI